MSARNDAVLISGAKRTPIGAFQGKLSKMSAPELGAVAIVAAIQQAEISKSDVSEVILGCVLPAGLGQAPARQAALKAGLDNATPCTTINKVCGSGMKAVMIAHDAIKAGSSDIIVAGGMESMSNAPYLLPKARAGYRLGHREVLDHMLFDGLQSPSDGQLMGIFAEKCAAHYAFSRQEQDEYAAESVRRAQRAVSDGDFVSELADVSGPVGKEGRGPSQDETPAQCDIGKIPTLRPAFQKDGTVTAANASSISDGAAALVLTRASGDGRGKGLANIVGHATFAREPEWFTVAPIGAINKLLKQVGWSIADVDLFEINEAFAVVTMAAIRDLKLQHDRVNVNGGACALGHPIGATGARILVTLVHALRARNLNRGIACLCLGGGEATAIAVQAI